MFKRKHRSAGNFFGRTYEDLLEDGFYSSFDTNIREHAHGYEMEIGVPGMRKRDLMLRVHNNVLYLTGTRPQYSSYFRRTVRTELEPQVLRRSYLLPKDVDPDGIRAQCRHGMLYLSIPRADGKAKVRAIPIKGPEHQHGLVVRTKRWWRRFLRRLGDWWGY